MSFRLSIFGMLLAAIFVLPSVSHATTITAERQADVDLDSLRYDLVVRGRYVAATMEAGFSTDSDEPAAAALKFPLPRGAVIHRAEIYLPDEDRWERAETLGRKEGQGAYDSPVNDDRQRLLVQQIGLDLYRARVAQLTSGAKVFLRVSYAHLLEPEADTEVLRIAQLIPGDHHATPKHGVLINVDAGARAWKEAAFSELGGDYAFEDGIGQLVLTDTALDRDITLRLTPSVRSAGIHSLRYVPTAPGLDKHTHVAWLPDLSAYPGAQHVGRNVIIVLDESGSMGLRIDDAKAAVELALNALEPEDQFGLVSFDTYITKFRDEMSSSLAVPEALAWLDGVRAQGNTAMGEALAAASDIGMTSKYPDRPIDVLLITDGNPSQGPDTVEEMVAWAREGLPRDRELRIFGCGIGHKLSQELINGLSGYTGGESIFALDDDDITGRVLELFSRIHAGGVSNAEIAIRGDGIRDALSLSRVFPGERVAVATTLDAPTLIELNGFVPGTVVDMWSGVPNGIGFGAPFNHIAAPLAAKAWTDAIQRKAEQNLETPELVDEAVVLAKTYGIVTRYSSLIALDSSEAYDTLGIERIERDPAGIALDPVATSGEDETRIGEGEGEGEGGYCEEAPGDPACSEGEGSSITTDGGADACACDVPGGAAPRAPHAIWLLLAAALVRRVSRATASAPSPR